MSAVRQAPDAISRPGDDVRYGGCDLLLTARASVGPCGAGAADPADEPFTVTMGLTARGPADGTVQIELGALTTSAMWTGHTSIVAGASHAGRRTS